MKKCVISIALVLAFSTALTSCAKNTEPAKSSSLKEETTTSASSSETTETTTVSTSETEIESTTTTTAEETSTETTEPSETTSTPDAGSSTGVKVHWDSYQKAEHSDPIVTRLREEPVEDFITSSDYGHVMPFCASHGERVYEYDGEIAERYGFIDAKGRLICDGVFSDCYRTKGGYTVYKAVPSTSEGTDKRVVGYLSADGSFYTGTIYDGCFYQGNNLCLMQLTSSGISYVTLDMTSRKMSEEKSLKLDDLLKMEDYYYYFEGGRIVNDRYFVSVGEQGEVLRIFDGETGKQIDLPTKDEEFAYPSLIGSTLLCNYTDWENESNSKSCLYSITGELLYEAKDMIRISNQRILLPLEDSLVMLDKNGKALASLPTNGTVRSEEVRSIDDYILLTTKDGLEIYDMELKLIRSIPEMKTVNYTLIYAYDYLDTGFENNYYIRPFDYSGDFAFIINVLTGEKTEIGSYPECSAIENTSYILVENGEQIMLGDFDYKFKYDFKIIDTKDGSIIYQSDRPASNIWTLSDIEGHAYMIITDYEDDSRKIFDFSSGEFLFNGEDPFPSGVSYIDEVYNGSFRCTSKEEDTYLIDRDGKVLFLYYPMVFDD